MSALFYHNELQKEIAHSKKNELEKDSGSYWAKKEVRTKILPLTTFYRAEDYHQKYRLQGNKFYFAQFKALYPDIKDLTDSSACARINGFLSGYGSLTLLQNELLSYGLPEEHQKALWKLVKLNTKNGVDRKIACPIPNFGD